MVFDQLRFDKRVKYLIFKGKIWTPDKGVNKYDGSNPHDKHCHISIKNGFGNDTSIWFPWMKKPTLINRVKARLPKPLPKKVG